MLRNTLVQFQKKIQSFLLYRSRLGLAETMRYAFQRLVAPKGKLIAVKPKNGKKLYLRNKSYDTIIFSQIFIYEELNFHLPSEPATIVDCGANIGLATLFFKFKYPNAQIISVEPESSNFELLKKNTGNYSDIYLIKKGIWSKSCDLFLIDDGQGNASFRVSETNPQKNIIGQIEAIGIEDIFNNFSIQNVDLLKIDIEGSEYTCFSSENLSWVNRANCIAIEIHEYMYAGCKALIDRSLSHRKYELNGEYHIYSKY